MKPLACSGASVSVEGLRLCGSRSRHALADSFQKNMLEQQVRLFLGEGVFFVFFGAVLFSPVIPTQLCLTLFTATSSSCSSPVLQGRESTDFPQRLVFRSTYMSCYCPDKEQCARTNKPRP